MLRGKNTKIGTHDPKNNFALKAHRQARSFADIGAMILRFGTPHAKAAATGKRTRPTETMSRLRFAASG